jgi:fluoride exporter
MSDHQDLERSDGARVSPARGGGSAHLEPDVDGRAVDARPSESAPRRSRLPERFQPDVVLAIAVGGALGAPARYGIAQWITVAPDGFPWATLLTNLSGAFVLGFFLTLVIARLPPTRYLRPFFAVGFLGSYTTFSTLAVETVLLIKDGHVALGVGYTLASVSAGLAVAYLGIVGARLLPGGEYR